MSEDGTGLAPQQRLRLEALRYAVNEEAPSYLAVMRVFTAGTAGLLSDRSAAEVRDALVAQGLELDVDTVEARLSYLVEHGNLARSPRETEARTLREYLANRARYQLTQRGELVQRQVEELLDHTEEAREVSSEMLPGILDGLRRLAALDTTRLSVLEPEAVARDVGTLFAQFERLVESTREFYTYLSQVLVRFDLDRAEFQLFKTALLDYLQRFVDEISRHLPQISQALLEVRPRVPAILARANEGARLRTLDGSAARRARGLDPADWAGLHAWFVGDLGRDADAAGVRRLATEAMRALLLNLRRIASTSEREQSRYADLLRLARWFDAADDPTAHALWAAAFGLYSCRHLSFGAGADAEGSEPLPATASWWRAPVTDVPVTLRQSGERKITGKSGRREDFSAAKRARLAARESAERRRAAALAEIAAHPGELAAVRLSDDARAALLEVYARAMSAGARPAAGREGSDATADAGSTAGAATFRLHVRRTPGRSSTVLSPAGRLELHDLTLVVEPVSDTSSEDGDVAMSAGTGSRGAVG
ncbi:MAG: TIGR02677 family protein [Motilibacteraceae bacterium]